MTDNNSFDVIIVGGSYSGLAAGMALGRALRKVLIIDNGKPSNRQTPYSHNFLTNDGKTPTEIAAIANMEVRRYETVSFFNSTATSGSKTENGFQIQVASGENFSAKKLIFATGIKDVFSPIDGLPECWGISVLHCPYCHGYEVRNETTGVLAAGDVAFDFTRLISNWTENLTLFTKRPSVLSIDQSEKLNQHRINIVEKEIERLDHTNGSLRNIIFKDGSQSSIKALYAPAPFEQHCKVPETLGCKLNEEGYIKIDSSFETTMQGVYAVGDNAAKMRTVVNAVAMGTSVGLIISKKMILEEF